MRRSLDRMRRRRRPQAKLGPNVAHQRRTVSEETTAPRGQEEFDLPEAQGEGVREPDGVGDDLGGEPVAVVRIGCSSHRMTLARPAPDRHPTQLT